MKIGPRKPSIKKSLSARTTGKAKRTIKRSVNPYYGKKGVGWINYPEKAAYNKIYNKTTSGGISALGILSFIILILCIIVFMIVVWLFS